MNNLLDILVGGESETIEFKSNFNVETIETLVAFANSKGGIVFIGVSDKNEITGVTIDSETLQNWVNEVKNKTAPQLIPDAEIVQYSEKQLVVLRIQEYPIKPVSFKGKYFKRVANSNHLLSISEVVNMHLSTFNTSWDYHSNTQCSLENISLEKVQLAIEVLNQSGKSVTDDPFTFLTKSELVRDNKITNAGYLLFTKEDTIMTTIELGRFQSEIIIKDTARTKTDIVTQVEQVLDFVRKHINKEVIITGAARNTQKWQYPMEAIREIVLNMIVHRDYRSASDSIVKIFDTKIEFFNPGRLPENITVDDLLLNNYTSTPRNKLIADFFKSIGLIEKYGSGIKRIVDYFKREKLPLPSFKNSADGFIVTVYSEVHNAYIRKDVKNVVADVVNNGVSNVVESVVEKERLLLEILHVNNKISAQQMAATLRIAPRTVQRYLKRLQEKGRLERIGSAKGGYWKIK